MTSSYKSHIAFILIHALWPTENSAMAYRLKTTGLDFRLATHGTGAACGAVIFLLRLHVVFVSKKYLIAVLHKLSNLLPFKQRWAFATQIF